MSQDLTPASHGLKPYHLNGADYAAMVPYDRMAGLSPIKDENVAFYVASEVDAQRAPVAGGVTDVLIATLKMAREQLHFQIAGNAGIAVADGNLYVREIDNAIAAALSGGALQGEAGERLAELEAMAARVNAPEVNDFLEGARLEAEHQRQRWGTDGDTGKSPEDWLWLVAFLATKATQAARYNDRDKYLHHIVTSAAVLLNWHRHATGEDTRFNPGAPDPEAAFLAAQREGKA